MSGEGQTKGPLLKVEKQRGGIDKRKKVGGRAGLICCYLIVMYTIGGGLIQIAIWLLTGCILFIPCRKAGRRCFLMARVSITPLRYELTPAQDCKACGNGFFCAFLWAILAGWHMMLFHWLMAILFIPFACCGIPASTAHFRLGRVSFRPFNAQVRRREEWEMFYAT